MIHTRYISSQVFTTPVMVSQQQAVQGSSTHLLIAWMQYCDRDSRDAVTVFHAKT